MKEIEFLNIDLYIVSKVDISSIVSEFGDNVSVQYNDFIDGFYHASFETGCTEENEIIRKYVSLINNLSPKAKEIWNKCEKREFDFGYESGEMPNNFHSKISAVSVSSIANVGGSFVITIYPCEMEKANQSSYGTSKEYSTDKHGNRVKLYDQILVLTVDERILKSLPEDEVQELRSFIGGIFTIVHINSDNSVLVEKEWRSEEEVMGHGLAVFPNQFEAMNNAT